jgi:hypothetical protein
MEEAQPPWFTAWSVKFQEPISDPRVIAAMLLQKRPDERWLLLGHATPVSERHLWAAWLALRERVNSSTMISNSIDGEFMRLLAGTHQMSVAFHRTGVRAGDEKAWLVRLPEWNESMDDDQISIIGPSGNYDDDLYQLMSWLECDLVPERPTASKLTIERLELTNQPNQNEYSLEQQLMMRLSITDLD